MATPPASVADELKSLRLERTREGARGLPGWAKAGLALAALAAVFLLGRAALRGFSALEVELAAVTQVSASQGAQLLVATGYVVPQRQANVSPRIGGRVAKLYVEDGTEVKEGQLLAVLEDADARAQLLQAQADARSAEAREQRAQVELLDAKRAFEREQMVQSKGVSTPAALDTATARRGSAEAQLAAARADVAAARARIEVARVNLENCYVRAPFAGRITQKLADIGEIVFGAMSAGSGGRGGIASLADFSTLEVEADVSESQVAKLAPGTPAEIVLDAFPERRFRGKVAEVRPRVDRAKATVTVKVAFVDDRRDVLPDMGAKVTFLQRELDAKAAAAPPTPAVAAEAIAERGDRKVVFAVGADGSVRELPVVPGPRLGNLISLRDGPPPGTRVVKSPPPELHDGMHVKEKP